MSKFQLGLLILFGFCIVAAVFIFSRTQNTADLSAKLTVWGSISAYDFSSMLSGSGLDKSKTVSFTYVEKRADTLDSELTEALAEGKGPDIVILPVESLLRQKSKLLLIPNASVKPALFSQTFITEGELFQTSEGTYALPLFVDPMVLYWNRSLLAKAGLATPPVYWDQIYDYIAKLTTKDAAGNIVASAIALGESRNIPHVKDILSLLMIQAGSPIVASTASGMRAALNASGGSATNPAQAALSFYTQFADPTKSFNTWNRSLLAADTNFAAEKSAMYLGFASELPTLKAKNPTLDLGIAPVPQSRVSGRSETFGRLYGAAIARGALNPSAALEGVIALAGKDAAGTIAKSTSLIPARRDILANTPGDPAGFVFYSAALQSRGWLDPDAAKTQKIFSDMAESVTSGRARVEGAVSTANNALDALLK